MIPFVLTSMMGAVKRCYTQKYYVDDFFNVKKLLPICSWTDISGDSDVGDILLKIVASSLLQFVAACCKLLQPVASCCSLSQAGAACCKLKPVASSNKLQAQTSCKQLPCFLQSVLSIPWPLRKHFQSWCVYFQYSVYRMLMPSSVWM